MEPSQVHLAVIDDHQLIREGFVAMIDRWPHGKVVLQAKDGIEYEHGCAEVGRINIAVVDLRMPRRDGYETIQWIVRHQPRTLPIALTFEPNPIPVKRALRAGARAVLSKTVQLPDLFKALDHVRIAGFHYNEFVSKELRRKVEEEDLQKPPDELWAKLTDREREFVLKYTDPKVPTLEDAARRMGIKPDTAEGYRKTAAAKLGAHSKAEMVRMVLENGWK